MDNDRKISVLMGIYNCQDTLGRAIESIMNQTYKNVELVMCDDGSADDTYQVALEYKKKCGDKIVLIKNERNMGLNITLNNCLKVSTGEFIARQDGDDFSLPERFAKQVEYLDRHPECAFVCTGMLVNNGSRCIGSRIIDWQFPTKKEVLAEGGFFHATVMIRREAMQAVGGYTEDVRLLRVEDYNLWTKLYAKGYVGANMSEPLYEVCEDDNVYSRRKFKYRLNGAYAYILAVDMLGFPKYYKLKALKGIAKGLIPGWLYRIIHRRKNIRE